MVSDVETQRCIVDTHVLRDKVGAIRYGQVVDLMLADGLNRNDARPCSFAFSTSPHGEDWRAFTFSELPIQLYLVRAIGASYGKIRSLASGIKTDNYILLAENGKHAILVLRRSKRDDNQPLLLVPIRGEDDCERVASTIRKFNFKSDELSAHSSLNTAVDLLRVGAQRYYVNRGLFANHYLKDRLFKTDSHMRKRCRRRSRWGWSSNAVRAWKQT